MSAKSKKVNCKKLWNSPHKSPVSGRKFKHRSPLLGKYIKQCQAAFNKDDCVIFKRFGEIYSPSGRRLKAGVRTKYHRKCSPKRVKKTSAQKRSAARRKLSAAKKRSARRKSAARRRSAAKKRSAVSKASCSAMGKVYRAASCAKKAKKKSAKKSAKKRSARRKRA